MTEYLSSSVSHGCQDLEDSVSAYESANLPVSHRNA